MYTTCFYISEFSYFNLKFGIKQSQIGLKFSEKWLPKVKTSGPLMTEDPLFQKCTNLKQPYSFIELHWTVKMYETEKTHLFYLVNKLTKPLIVRDEN